MRSTLTVSTFCCITTSLSACFPAPVDPEAVYTITGSLVDEQGEPAANAQVRLYLLDEWTILREDDLLHFGNLDDYPGLVSQTAYTADSNGDFSIELRGEEVNSPDDHHSYHACLVYQADGSATAYLATASKWDTFGHPDDPIEVGALRLWDGGACNPQRDNCQTATQSGNEVRFEWRANDAPDGNDRDEERPVFVYAFGQTGDLPRWAGFAMGDELTMPRGAYADDETTSPDYFLVAYSEESGGDRSYQHRTRLRTDGGRPIRDWAAIGVGDNNYLSGPGAVTSATLVDEDGNDLTDNDAQDGDTDTPHHFLAPLDGVADRFYIDLGAPREIRDVLLHRLGGSQLAGSVIEIAYSPEHAADPRSVASWQTVALHAVDFEFGDWAYVGFTADPGVTKTARWIRVEAKGTNASQTPTLELLCEAVVKY